MKTFKSNHLYIGENANGYIFILTNNLLYKEEIDIITESVDINKYSLDSCFAIDFIGHNKRNAKESINDYIMLNKLDYVSKKNIYVFYNNILEEIK